MMTYDMKSAVDGFHVRVCRSEIRAHRFSFGRGHEHLRDFWNDLSDLGNGLKREVVFCHTDCSLIQYPKIRYASNEA